MEDPSGFEEGVSALNTELLDFLQASADMSALQYSHPDEAGDTSPPPPPPSHPQEQHRRLLSSPLFLLGGSLFRRVDCGKPHTATPLHARTGGHARIHDGRGGRVWSWLVGSMFCPFTKQFFSTRSPHLTHLRAAGFDVDMSMSAGRRCTLVHPIKLYQLACSLQGRLCVTPARAAGAAPQLVTKAPPSWARADAATTLHWSPLLRSTLGVLLETSPVDNLDTFIASVMSIIEESDLTQARHIPLALPPPLSWNENGVAALYSREEASLQASADAHRWSGPHPSSTTATSRSAAAHCRAVTEPLERICVDRATQWRRSVLQWHPKWRYSGAASATPTERRCRAFSAPHCDASGGHCHHHDWASRLSEATALPVRGLPSNPRATYLHVQCPTNISEAPAVMERVCGGLLSELLESAAERETSAAHSAAEVHYCPVEHSVDYNSVADLQAFPIHRAAVTHPPPLHFFSAASHAGAASPPLLMVGLEAPPRPVSVVVSNAHLLSKRAIGRLLDQWTRNGAAQRISGASAVYHQRAGGPGARRWRLLLGVEPFTKTLRSTYTHPLGSVQVVFVGLRRLQNAGETGGGGAEDVLSGAALAGMEDVRVTSEPGEDAFRIEEPLAGTLMRLSSLYQHALTPIERVELLTEVCAAVRGSTPSAAPALRTWRWKMLPSGRRVFHEAEVPPDSSQGRRLLRDACEGVLNTVAPPSPPLSSESTATATTSAIHHMERHLLSYPFLSTIKVWHSILRTYSVRVVTAATQVPAAAAAEEAATSTVTCEVDVCPVESPAVAVEWEMTAAARSTVGHVNTTAIPTQSYSGYLEPAVLLGCWTPTLLFCAPMVADVVPLRWHLRTQLERLYHQLSVPPKGAQLGVDTGTSEKITVVDVDVYHIDFARFHVNHRCRLFGVRAMCTTPSGLSEPEMAHAATVVFRTLNRLLRQYASAPLFFPLWSYEVRRCGDHLRGTPHAHRSCRLASSQAPGDTLPPKSHGPHYAFSTVNEWEAPCVPNIVQRRLFALAAAQHQPLHLTTGSRVVLQDTMWMSTTAQSRSESCADCGLEVALPRGTVGIITGFVSAGMLSQSHDTGYEHSGGLWRWHRDRLSAAALNVANYYMDQQQHATALPILRPLQPSVYATSQREYVVLPKPILVGGYASLHYYALPLLHLPLQVLAGHVDGCQCSRGTDTVSDGLEGGGALCYASTRLYHPYYGHPQSPAVVCLTPAQRCRALAMLLKRERCASIPEGETDPFAFVEDVLFTNGGFAVAANANVDSTPVLLPPSRSHKTSPHCPDPVRNDSADSMAAIDRTVKADICTCVSSHLLTELSLFQALDRLQPAT